jgi:hypothetical protein
MPLKLRPTVPVRPRTRPSHLSGPVARSSNLLFFLARVEQSRVEGDAATLDHVRERCRRAEAAWQALADKAQRSERMRAAEAQRKADENSHA